MDRDSTDTHTDTYKNAMQPVLRNRMVLPHVERRDLGQREDFG